PEEFLLHGEAVSAVPVRGVQFPEPPELWRPGSQPRLEPPRCERRAGCRNGHVRDDQQHTLGNRHARVAIQPETDILTKTHMKALTITLFAAFCSLTAYGQQSTAK